jgi:ABC-type branched-subunit amino acid transport system ATPase component/ABC-type branched-subunit amino acid transport system permease subunit
MSGSDPVVSPSTGSTASSPSPVSPPPAAGGSGAGEAADPPRPPAFRGHPYAVILAVLAGLYLVRLWRTEGLAEQNLFNTWLFMTCIVVGFWFVFGVAGQFAFSQAAFAGLGAYTAAWMTGNGHSFELAALVAVLVCTALALAFALLVRRAEHLYFAIATLGLSEVLLLVFRSWQGFTGGGEVTNIEPISLFGWEVSGPDRDQRAFWLLLVLLGLLLALGTALERSPVVREAIAVRDRPLVASSLGLPGVRIRAASLGLGSAIAGLTGAVLVHWRSSATTEQFGVDLGLAVFLMLILGGMHSKYGPLLGAWFYVYVEHSLRDISDRLEFLEDGALHSVYTFSENLDQYWPIVWGSLLVIVMIALPDGLIGIASRLRGRAPATTGPLARLALPAVSDLVARFRPAQSSPQPAQLAQPTPPGTDAGPVAAPAGSASVAEPDRDDVPAGGAREDSDAASPILRTRGVGVSFGGVRAVDGIDLEVTSGEILGLIGPNGSGKSTLLNAVTGVVPAEGVVEVAGVPVPTARPQRIRRAGVARTYQTPQTFTSLTCIENVLLGVPDRQRTGILAGAVARPVVLADERRRWAQAQAALERVGLPDHAERPAAGLPHRDQRLLELARALVGQPRIILLDEPSAGLNAAETDALCELLVGLRAEGLSLLVVDHKIDFITDLCDRVVVLELGHVIAEGDPHEIWSDQRVVDVYLGVPPEPADEPGESNESVEAVS